MSKIKNCAACGSLPYTIIRNDLFMFYCKCGAKAQSVRCASRQTGYRVAQTYWNNLVDLINKKFSQ